jgi:hypothetical protein
LVSSCKKDFTEINTNPNEPSQVQPELLLRQIIYNYGEEMSYEGFVTGNLLSQHFTMVDFNLFDRHELSSPQLGGNPWPVIYRNLLDNEVLLEQSRTNPGQSVYEGPALILKSYMAAALTDLYGDVPYIEALRGDEGIVAPQYDDQESIYLNANGILDNLDRGIAAIENYEGAIPLAGDLLFNGDLNKWIIFANSLKIKYLMRISGVENVSTQLAAIVNSGLYMQSNSDNATFSFTDGRPNSFRMQQLRDGDFNLFILSETMEEVLKDLNDPRLELFFRPIGNDPSSGEYKGLLNGPDASQTSISINEYSLPGTIFRENTGDLKANFLTSWETGFFLAEAAERQLIPGDPKAMYEEAVRQAYDYWNTPLPSNIFAIGEAVYSGSREEKIEKILTQKWIANTINGYEGWIEFRRTGYPQLKPVAASLNGNEYPVRLPYPADETALNAENVEEATGMSGNSVNLKVWWDVN